MKGTQPRFMFAWETEAESLFFIVADIANTRCTERSWHQKMSGGMNKTKKFCGAVGAET